jgi:hypothetical protein
LTSGASFGKKKDQLKKHNIASLLTVSVGGNGVPVTTPDKHISKITKIREILLMSQMAVERTYYAL